MSFGAHLGKGQTRLSGFCAPAGPAHTYAHFQEEALLSPDAASTAPDAGGRPRRSAGRPLSTHPGVTPGGGERPLGAPAFRGDT